MGPLRGKCCRVLLLIRLLLRYVRRAHTVTVWGAGNRLYTSYDCILSVPSVDARPPYPTARHPPPNTGHPTSVADSTIACALNTQFRACRRQWLRVLWCPEFHSGVLCGVRSPHTAAALEPHKSLLAFFKVFPGLRRLIGGLVVLYSRPQARGVLKAGS